MLNYGGEVTQNQAHHFIYSKKLYYLKHNYIVSLKKFLAGLLNKVQLSLKVWWEPTHGYSIQIDKLKNLQKGFVRVE